MQHKKTMSLVALFLCVCISLSAMYTSNRVVKPLKYYTLVSSNKIKTSEKETIIRSTDESGKVTFCVQKIKTNRNQTPLLECTTFFKKGKHYYWLRYLTKENDKIDIWIYKKDSHIKQDYEHWQNTFKKFDDTQQKPTKYE